MPVLSFFPRKFPVFYGHGVTFSSQAPAVTLEDGTIKLKTETAQQSATGASAGTHQLLLLFTPLWVSAYEDGALAYRLPRPDRAAPYRLDCPSWLEPAPQDALAVLCGDDSPLAAEDRAVLVLMLTGTDAAQPLISALADGEQKAALEGHLERQVFAARKTAAINAAKQGQRAEALTIVAHTLDRMPPPPAPRRDASRLARPARKGAILGDFSLPQCRHYRVEQKLEQFARLGIDVVCHEMPDTTSLCAALPELDFLILYRLPLTPSLLDVIRDARHAAVPIAYETDDLLFDADAFPAPAEDYPANFGADEYAELQILPPMYLRAMALCDHVITSTPPLMQRAGEMLGHDRLSVHVNGLDGRHAAAAACPRGREDGALRLFYGSGTKAQQSDFAALAADVLAPFLSGHADVRLTVAGQVELPSCLKAFASQIQTLEPQNLQDYWTALAAADVFLAPLARNAFNDCKSAIKWLETANLGIATVASKTPAFESVIRSGEDGYLCERAGEWLSALEQLAARPEEARRMGAQAHTRAMADFAAAKLDQNLAAIIASLRS